MERRDEPSHCRIDVEGAFYGLFLDKRQASRCDAGDAEDSRDRMVLAFRQNAGARSCISESGWCWCDLGFCQGT